MFVLWYTQGDVKVIGREGKFLNLKNWNYEGNNSWTNLSRIVRGNLLCSKIEGKKKNDTI